MPKSRKLIGSLGAALLTATLMIGAPAPANAGVGGCSSLAADGQYIVGSCTANYPSPTATITVSYSCWGAGWAPRRAGVPEGASVIRQKITVGYGSSFRVKSSCWTWVTDLQRVG